MTLTRAAALAMIVGAVAAATAIDRVPARTAARVDGQLILAADFHVHAWAGDGGMPPWEIGREARRRGLDVIVISNHNQRLAARVAGLASWIYPGAEGALVIRGQELTTPRFHMVAAAITETIDWRLSASEALAAIHRQGGIGIAAHPSRPSWAAFDDPAFRLLDGAEVAHPAERWARGVGDEFREFFARAAAIKPGVAPIGSSDFHFGGTLGECRTYIFADEYSEPGVLNAVRRGATVASDGHGRLTGDPARVEIVRRLLATDPPPLRAPWPSRVAAYVAVLGVLLALLRQ